MIRTTQTRNTEITQNNTTQKGPAGVGMTGSMSTAGCGMGLQLTGKVSRVLRQVRYVIIMFSCDRRFSFIRIRLHDPLLVLVCLCSEYLQRLKGKKVKKADLYSAFIEVPHTQGAQVYGSHTVTCKLHRTCLYLVSIQQMAHPQTEVADI